MMDIQDLKDHKDLKAHRDQKDQKAQLDHKDQWEAHLKMIPTLIQFMTMICLKKATIHKFEQ